MTQVDIHEQIWHALPDGWITHQQACDAIRGVTVGGATFAGACAPLLDHLVSQLVDLGFVTARTEYRTEPMDASSREKYEQYQRQMNIWTNLPAERAFVVFWYQRRPLSEVPIVESRRRAVEEVKAAIKQQHDADDMQLEAALARRAARTAATTTITTQED
jgi:hypothetical protein